MIKALLVGLATTGTGCFGSFKAVRWVYDLNKGISGNKFIQWLVFLGLVILPVYELAGLIDLWVLNSLEFWFGGSSSAENGSEERTIALNETHTLTMRKDVEAGRLLMVVDNGTQRTEFVFEMREDRARVLLGEQVLAEARSAADGGVEVLSGGQVVDVHDPSAVQALLAAYQTEGGRGAAMWARQAQKADHVIASR